MRQRPALIRYPQPRYETKKMPDGRVLEKFLFNEVMNFSVGGTIARMCDCGKAWHGKMCEPRLQHASVLGLGRGPNASNTA